MTHAPEKLNTPATLLLGIGNSARRDDGLGWAFLDVIREQGQFAGEITYRYQLQVEDADVIRAYQTVIFVDALHQPLEAGFYWKPCLPVATFGFSTHALNPESVVALCQELYGEAPEAYTLGISGYDWELAEGLSRAAIINLRAALLFFEEKAMKY
ncbi:MAG: hydrogenase maturation protease [Phaeodactylibacter sp.]|nr:hydrogenase maturation protease [Phaeodactylibacter sp.]MCB9293374.1 hydrogenase maturation protease [Lewinellaceae bacterium]